MLPLRLGSPEASAARVLAIGAHPDDIEIGCAGTILKLIEQEAVSEIHWVVLSGEDERAAEARQSAEALLEGVPRSEVVICDFRDGFFPYEGQRIKDFFEGLKADLSPDVVFTHQRADLHQDHRLSCELTWNTFRDHLILEYEIPKYDGDLGAPNVFVPLDQEVVAEKLALLQEHFPSQSARHWFDDELFRGLMRLRGMESATQYAEAFTCRKLLIHSGRS
jgi:LmbE family N-acetylglucosaminyl deacetylase